MRYLILVNGKPEMHTATVQQALQVSDCLESGRVQIRPVPAALMHRLGPLHFISAADRAAWWNDYSEAHRQAVLWTLINGAASPFALDF